MQRLFAAVARVRCHNPFTSPGFKRTVSVAPSPKQERNNFIIAGGLFAGVGGVYYYTMNMLWAVSARYLIHSVSFLHVHPFIPGLGSHSNHISQGLCPAKIPVVGSVSNYVLHLSVCITWAGQRGSHQGNGRSRQCLFK